jgi:hypothetical protein
LEKGSPLERRDGCDFDTADLNSVLAETPKEGTRVTFGQARARDNVGLSGSFVELAGGFMRERMQTTLFQHSGAVRVAPAGGKVAR